MNHSTRRILSIALVFILLVLEATDSFASTYGNTTAFSVGTYYDINLNTSVDAGNAHTSYYSAGLTSYYTTMPTISIMGGSHSSTGQDYLASGIVFLSGHGNATSMYWDYCAQGGNYFTGVKSGNSSPSGSSPYYYGLISSNFTLSDVAMYVFAGCNTASGTNNLANSVIKNDGTGARMSIGWTTPTNGISHSSWLQRFNNSIVNGNSLYAACSYSDSFSYIYNNVKNHAVYGAYHLNPLSLLGISINPSKNSAIERTPIIEIHGVSETNVSSTISRIISDLYPTHCNLFFIEENGSDDIRYYDAVMYYENVRTNMALTFAYDKRIDSLKVYDNMLDNDINAVKNSIDILLSSSNTREQLTTDTNKVIDSITDTVTQIDSFLYYDVNGRELCTAIGFVAIDEYGLSYSNCILNLVGIQK